ncbi:hypothetical protein N324_07445, partial [Chlamydotis macqueenii]
NGFKIEAGRFGLDIKKNFLHLGGKQFFTVRVVEYWNMLPREVVDAPSLQTFKARLDEALSNLI